MARTERILSGEQGGTGCAQNWRVNRVECNNLAGFSRLDVAVMAGLIALVVGLAVATPGGRASGRAERAACMSHLKDLGLATRLAASDQDQTRVYWITNRFDPGADEPALFFRTFSNLLATPKLLVCPSDRARTVAASFTNLASSNLSYFANLSADVARPQDLLMGDRNLEAGGVAVPRGRFVVTNGLGVTWTRELHFERGHALMADGSVHQFSASRLNQLLGPSWGGANVFLVP
jgi:hypothetical protein